MNWEDYVILLTGLASFFAAISQLEPRLAIVPIVLGAIIKALKDIKTELERRG
ncbi:MAG: hypothetical protein LZ158_02755 [Thaumarchaeota archaeon]|jgi:hypothetical protein|nr:hypothetical protein [Candidatus Terraquivivens yellowstonensis]MCL7387093.1 hypothetical protein [Candidatus Terraquivivens yellowstonensis]MCL7392665.1 hypothetical protein [Candidatus Terraquivivens yellowstonensis]MCL7394932.1 hypothetical protein [Candidatus Terraquivivens yellowstonensis]MCL7397903.1 hypothetical protein [Candidatus Terraquivivens yellowstonensis]